MVVVAFHNVQCHLLIKFETLDFSSFRASPLYLSAKLLLQGDLHCNELIVSFEESLLSGARSVGEGGGGLEGNNKTNRPVFG